MDSFKCSLPYLAQGNEFRKEFIWLWENVDNKEKTLICACNADLFTLQDFAIDVIKSTHDHWRALVTKKIDGKGISW